MRTDLAVAPFVPRRTRGYHWLLSPHYPRDMDTLRAVKALASRRRLEMLGVPTNACEEDLARLLARLAAPVTTPGDSGLKYVTVFPNVST